MTAPNMIDPAALLGQALSDASPDLMRHLLATVINALLSADADAVCGAEYGVASPERVNSRGGCAVSGGRSTMNSSTCSVCPTCALRSSLVLRPVVPRVQLGGEAAGQSLQGAEHVDRGSGAGSRRVGVRRPALAGGPVWHMPSRLPFLLDGSVAAGHVHDHGDAEEADGCAGDVVAVGAVDAEVRPGLPRPIRLPGQRPRVLRDVLRLLQPRTSPLPVLGCTPRPRCITAPPGRSALNGRRRCMLPTRPTPPASVTDRRPTPPQLPTAAWINQPSRESLIQNN